MTDITIPFGKTNLTAHIPDHWTVQPVRPSQADAAADPLAVAEAALDNPIGGIGLEDFAGAGSAAIAINDKTRPVPHAQLLPPLLKRLEEMGILPEDITLVIATGTHPVMPPEQYRWILPEEIVTRYPIICHDAQDKATHVYLGETTRRTPVVINRHYMAADLRIVVGNIEPHQFQGFSGGVKSAAIGLAAKETINHNHAMMTHDHARLGIFDTNPARQDVEEIGHLINIHFAHNALLNDKKQIVHVLAGDPFAIMKQAIPQVKQIYQVSVGDPFDLMIVSPGGHPKDINMYQSQKGFAHATLVMKAGGTVILCAACPEGTGSDSYEQWITDESMTSYEAVFERFGREGFHIGPHKAFQIARDAAKVRVLLISLMEPEFVRRLLLLPAADLQSAIDAVAASLPPDARIGIMPAANSTIPVLSKE